MVRLFVVATVLTSLAIAVATASTTTTTVATGTTILLPPTTTLAVAPHIFVAMNFSHAWNASAFREDVARMMNTTVGRVALLSTVMQHTMPNSSTTVSPPPAPTAGNGTTATGNATNAPTALAPWTNVTFVFVQRTYAERVQNLSTSVALTVGFLKEAHAPSTPAIADTVRYYAMQEVSMGALFTEAWASAVSTSNTTELRGDRLMLPNDDGVLVPVVFGCFGGILFVALMALLLLGGDSPTRCPSCVRCWNRRKQL